mmetsp:Transcript_35237/g.88784  ORF Transcript_35237/g.88784 Transcript_35237/m.88784 type:complete len:208 (+) Transcript_35237:105-728(+)
MPDTAAPAHHRKGTAQCIRCGACAPQQQVAPAPPASIGSRRSSPPNECWRRPRDALCRHIEHSLSRLAPPPSRHPGPLVTAPTCVHARLAWLILSLRSPQNARRSPLRSRCKPSAGSSRRGRSATGRSPTRPRTARCAWCRRRTRWACRAPWRCSRATPSSTARRRPAWRSCAPRAPWTCASCPGAPWRAGCSQASTSTGRCPSRRA